MGCNEESIAYSNQIQAGFVMLICCDETRAFVKEWLHYCEDHELMSPEGGLSLTEERGRGFVTHREDQSILSLLCKKKEIKPHKDPSQRGKCPETFYSPYYEYRVPEHLEDRYGTVLFLHKAKKPSFWVCVKISLIAIRSKYRYHKNRRK